MTKRDYWHAMGGWVFFTSLFFVIDMLSKEMRAIMWMKRLNLFNVELAINQSILFIPPPVIILVLLVHPLLLFFMGWMLGKMRLPVAFFHATTLAISLSGACVAGNGLHALLGEPATDFIALRHGLLYTLRTMAPGDVVIANFSDYFMLSSQLLIFAIVIVMVLYMIRRHWRRLKEGRREMTVRP